MDAPVGLYISVPFCRAKCTFCNFASDVFGEGRLQAYVDRLCAEIRAVRAGVPRGAELGERVDTVYLGGGTPSLLSAGQVREIFAVIRGEFMVETGAEVTLECAPGQLEDATLEAMLGAGMNRVSFGVQSFVDREAAAVGRRHTRAVCEAEIARMRAAGVGNIGVDLIAGLPHQTGASWRESVDAVLQTEVPHASVYMLEVDEESRLGREMLGKGMRYGAGAVPHEDEVAEWYEAGCGWLEAGGMRQYEISNFARAGFASRHNVKYWRREAYVGFGLDAHSMLRCGDGAVRWANGDDLDGYMASGVDPLGLRSGGQPTVEWVGSSESFEEAMFLGLRMNQGVDLAALQADFGERMVAGAVEAAQEMVDAGLVMVDGSTMRLTHAGRMASNEVFERLLGCDSVTGG